MSLRPALLSLLLDGLIAIIAHESSASSHQQLKVVPVFCHANALFDKCGLIFFHKISSLDSRVLQPNDRLHLKVRRNFLCLLRIIVAQRQYDRLQPALSQVNGVENETRKERYRSANTEDCWGWFFCGMAVSRARGDVK